MSRNPSIHPLTAALFYHACGWCVVPILADGSKKPAVAWQDYIQQRPTEENLRRWFEHGDKGIALIQGTVSGNSELLEFETEETFARWYRAMCERGHRDIAERLNLCVFSPGGGVHLYYRHDAELMGNKALAKTKAVIEGHKQGSDGYTTLIETRGQGGYVLAPGSLPECHKSGKTYQLAHGSSFKHTPCLTAAEREAVFAACKSLDERPAKPVAPKPQFIPTTGDGKPGEDFDTRGSAEALACLIRHGWTIDRDFGDWQMLCRPGKSEGGSATFGKVAPGVLHAFSSNAAPFETESNSGPFKIVAMLDFGGDFKACAKHLAGQGFGTPLPQPGAKPSPETRQASCRKPSDNLLDAEQYKAMKLDARRAHIRLVAVLRLCELELLQWPDPLPTQNPELLTLSKTMSLPDCIEFLLAEIGTQGQGRAWGLLRDVDEALDEAEVYVDHMDCIEHYTDWLDGFLEEKGW